jgi:hypothetical protein
MPFDWREYLQLSGFLHGGVGSFTEEAGWRSAVSRAYYAAFGHARNFARDREGFLTRGTPEDHDRLRDHFRQQRQDRLAQSLGRLRHWRNQCDYDDDVPGLSQIVGAATLTAREVINQL